MAYVRVGVAGPVSSGKTALTEELTRRMAASYSIGVVTNDIYTKWSCAWRGCRSISTTPCTFRAVMRRLGVAPCPWRALPSTRASRTWPTSSWLARCGGGALLLRARLPARADGRHRDVGRVGLASYPGRRHVTPPGRWPPPKCPRTRSCHRPRVQVARTSRQPGARCRGWSRRPPVGRRNGARPRGLRARAA